MVLPAEHADTIRSLKGGGHPPPIVINVQAMDAKSFHGYLRDNRGSLSQVIQGAVRDGQMLRG